MSSERERERDWAMDWAVFVRCVINTTRYSWCVLMINQDVTRVAPWNGRLRSFEIFKNCIRAVIAGRDSLRVRLWIELECGASLQMAILSLRRKRKNNEGNEEVWEKSNKILILSYLTSLIFFSHLFEKLIFQPVFKLYLAPKVLRGFGGLERLALGGGGRGRNFPGTV